MRSAESENSESVQALPSSAPTQSGPTHLPTSQSSSFGSLSLVVASAVVIAFCSGWTADEAAGHQTENTGSGVAAPQKPSSPGLSFSRLPVASVQSSVLEWLARAGADEDTSRRVTALWADQDAIAAASAEELLDRVIESFAIVDPATRRFREQVMSALVIDSPVFDGIRAEPFYRDSVALYHARWLTQHRLYDEALALLEPMNPERCLDPASLFFYRAVCQQKLLRQQEATDSVSLLLNNTLDVPQRFRVVGNMMMAELRGQDEEGLSEAARLMSDVQRRLDLGRSGEKVQNQEDEVIAVLDKLLDDMQKQQNPDPQGGQGGGGGNQNQPGSRGADQSTIKGNAADGNADRKELSESGAWGMLDKQAETKARELIRQQFPSNYLDAISRYTKKIAERK